MTTYVFNNHVYGIPKDDNTKIYKCVKSPDYCEVVECSNMEGWSGQMFTSRKHCEGQNGEVTKSIKFFGVNYYDCLYGDMKTSDGIGVKGK